MVHRPLLQLHFCRSDAACKRSANHRAEPGSWIVAMIIMFVIITHDRDYCDYLVVIVVMIVILNCLKIICLFFF